MRKRYLFALAGSAMLILASEASAQSTTTYTYDDLGRLKSATPPAGSARSYAYDKADNRTCASTSSVCVDPNHAPVCPSYTINVNPPTSSPVTITVPFGSGCTDADGDTLTVTSPSWTNLTVNIHTSNAYPYTVSDGHGGVGSGVVTVTRP